MSENEQGRRDARNEIKQDGWTRETAEQFLSMVAAKDEYSRGFDAQVREHFSL